MAFHLDRLLNTQRVLMYRAIYMNDIHIQMQPVYIVILSATGYCYSIIDSILACRLNMLNTVFFPLAGVRKIRARDTIGPMLVCES